MKHRVYGRVRAHIDVRSNNAGLGFSPITAWNCVVRAHAPHIQTEATEQSADIVRIQVADDQYSLPEVSAMVLKEMKAIAEAHLGQPVTKAVVTVPGR